MTGNGGRTANAWEAGGHIPEDICPSVSRPKVGQNGSVDHLSGYQARDVDVIDYQLYQLDGTDLWFRGPRDPRAVTAPTIACLGAAQTFGCFAEEPYPALLADRLDVPVLNLGYGGAGPGFYLRHPELLERISGADVVVVQVMSGRSESNSMFDSGGLEYLRRRSDGGRVSADAAFAEILYGRRLAEAPLSIPVRAARKLAPRLRRRTIAQIVAQTRAEWIENYRALLDAIPAPTVLAWFSVREPDITDDLSSVSRLLDRFPQLVNQAMIDAVIPHADEYVQCTTSRGLPQPLVSRHTGDPITVDPARDRPDLGGRVWTHNEYYPSPEMQLDLADLLEPICSTHVGVGR